MSTVYAGQKVKGLLRKVSPTFLACLALAWHCVGFAEPHEPHEPLSDDLSGARCAALYWQD